MSTQTQKQADQFIPGVMRLSQRDDTIYMFSLAAEHIKVLCRVERFGQDVEGVNRMFDPDHALRISQAMIDQRILWLEPICGDLRGDWRFKDGKLFYGPNAYISVDDGQHRIAALEALNAEEKARIVMPITV